MPARLLLILLMLAPLAAEASGRDDKLHLFVLSGQSNMVALDPEEIFIPTVKAAFPDDEIVVAKFARDGRTIESWVTLKEGGEPRAEALLKAVVDEINKQLGNRTPHTITFVWMQGERDAQWGLGDKYAASLQGLEKLLMEELGIIDMYTVIGRLSDLGVEKPNEFPDWNQIREIQVAFAEASPSRAWVNTDDLNETGDGLHYDAKGRKELGSRFAEAVVTLLKDDSGS